MAKGRKTGGRVVGSKNKPKQEILPPDTAKGLLDEAARALVLTTAPVRTPKAVMLDAMLHFEGLGKGFLAKADKRLKKRGVADALVIEAAQEGHKFIVAAVECATKVAPYIHARLLAVESRGDMTQDKAPYVLRVPAVLADSTAWQAAVGAALIDDATQKASGAAPEALPHPAMPQPAALAPAPMPALVPLVADQTGRISTMMPPGPKVVRPAGAQEWLAAVAERRKAAG